MNLHWNNSFINWMQLPLLCEKSEAILLLVLVGLTAVRQAVRRILVDSKNFKILYSRILVAFNKGIVLL